MISDDQTEVTIFFVIDDDGRPFGSPWEYKPEAIHYAKAANEHEGGTRYTVSQWTYTHTGQQLVWAPEWETAPESARRVLGLGDV